MGGGLCRLVLGVGGVCVLEALRGWDGDQVGTGRLGKECLGKGMSEKGTGENWLRSGSEMDRGEGALGFRFEMERLLGKGCDSVWNKNVPWWGALGCKIEMERVLVRAVMEKRKSGGSMVLC